MTHYGSLCRNTRPCYPFTQTFLFLTAVIQILFVFVKLFNKSREENAQQAEAEKKKLEKEAMKEKAAAASAAKKEGLDLDRSKLNPINRRR